MEKWRREKQGKWQYIQQSGIPEFGTAHALKKNYVCVTIFFWYKWKHTSVEYLKGFKQLENWYQILIIELKMNYWH